MRNRIGRIYWIAKLQEDGTIPASARWAQVTLTTDTLPNEVMAVAASFDDSLRYGAQTPFSDQMSFHLEGAAWQVDQNHDSIIAAGNGGAKPVKARLTFFYGNGMKQYRIEQTIAPDDQMWVDVGKLIRDQVPDKDGNLLPSDLTTGAYQLRDLAETPTASLYEGKVVTDKTYGHATYGCMICCGYRGAQFNPDPVIVGVDDEGGLEAEGLNACTGGGLNWINLDGYAGDWASANTAILSVQPRQVQGVSAGSTTASATLNNIIYGPPIDTGEGNSCPLQDVPVQTPGNVAPTISGISPSQGLVGTGITVTITGTGFAAGAKVNAGSNISVSSVNVASSTQITATFTPSNSTSAGGNQGVTVTVSEQTSNSQNFFVQYPLHLVYVDEPTTPNNGHSTTVSGTDINIVLISGATAATGVCGGYQWLTYTPTDQSGNQINNGTIEFTEAFSNFSPARASDPFGYPAPNSGTVTFPGYLGDTQAIWIKAPPACEPAGKTDSFNQQFTAAVAGVNYSLTTVVTIARSTNSQGVPSFNVSITTP